MEQLYEAMPIPSSSDDEANPTQSPRHGHSGAVSDLDVSAHGSFSDDFCSSASSCNAAHQTESGDSVSADEREKAHRRVFSTSSSPEELCRFLVDLLRLAEQLHARLCSVIPEDSPSCQRSAASPPAPSTSSASRPPLLSPTQQHSQHAGSTAAAFNVARTNCGLDSRLHHTPIRAASCPGIAKLRGRLRKETESIRRAVDGMRAAGCGGASDLSQRDAAIAVPPPVFSAAVSCAQCNSLSHFEGVVTCLERESGTTGIYVPVSGHVGPPQCRAAASVARPAFADDVRIEVDVVSCNGHRWIKVKTATARNLKLEAAALDLNGSTPFTEMLLALSERASRACLPHRQKAHVAVVFLHPPPPSLRVFLESHHIAWASLPTAAHGQVHRAAAAVSPATSSWLPPLFSQPSFVCLDTTALVTLCSQSCYADAMPLVTRLQRLAPYKVLQEQQRKEAVEAAVTAVMEPALRPITRWCTAAEINATMRQALLREGGGGRGGDTAERWSQPSERATSASREACVPRSLIREVDLTWLAPLQKAAEQRPSDAAEAEGYTRANTAVNESQLLRKLSDQQTSGAAAARRPNWVVADITYDEFRWILETIAGPEEVARATRLLHLVTVVDTRFLRERMKVERGVPVAVTTAFRSNGSAAHVASTEEEGRTQNGCTPATGAAHATCGASLPAAAASPTLTTPPLFTSVEYLRLSGKVSLRNKIVFGLADAVEAVIVTSNEQLCHAAREQGICIDACFHPSRSLTEQKMHQLRRRHGPGKPPAVL